MILFQQEEGKYCCGVARPQLLLTNYHKHSNLQQQNSQCLKFTVATSPLAIKIIYIYVNTAGVFSPQLSKGSRGEHSVPPACPALKGQPKWGCRSQNHRILDSFRLKKTSKVIELNHQPNTTMSWSPMTTCFWNTSRDGDSTAPFQQPIPVFFRENFFPDVLSKFPLARYEDIFSLSVIC